MSRDSLVLARIRGLAPFCVYALGRPILLACGGSLALSFRWLAMAGPAGRCNPSWLGYSGSNLNTLFLQRTSLERRGSGPWWRITDPVCYVASQHPSSDFAGSAGWCGSEPQGVASDGDDPCCLHVACVEATPADGRPGPISRSCSCHGSPGSSTSSWGFTHEEDVSVKCDGPDGDSEIDLMTRTELDQAHLWHIDMTGAEPSDDAEPTSEQIPALGDRIVRRGESPYADDSPHSHLPKTRD